MARIRSDWYRQPPPAETAEPAPAAVTRTTRVTRRPVTQRGFIARMAGDAPAWQRMGAMLAGSLLALVFVGALIFGAVAAPDDGVVAGEQARQSAPVGAGAGGLNQAAGAAGLNQPAGAAGTQGTITSGDPAIDQALREEQRAGRLTQEQVAALSRAIAGQPTFEDVRRLTDEDIQRLADATGLPPAQLAPLLARLVATGRIALPVAPAQAVAAPRATRVTSITRDTVQTGAGPVEREVIVSRVVTATPTPRPIPAEAVAGEQARAPLPTAVPRWPQSGAPVVDPRVTPVK